MASAFEISHEPPPGDRTRSRQRNPGKVPTLSAGIVHGKPVACGDAILAFGYDSEYGTLHIRIIGEWTAAACLEAVRACTQLRSFCADLGDLRGRITDCRHMKLGSESDAASYAAFDLKLAEFARGPHAVIFRGEGYDRFAEQATRFSRCKTAYRTEGARAWLINVLG